ncbi:MAG: histidinol-phosphatase [Bacteroidales bacterium]
MNNLTNYHSHCSFCDGKADAEDFIREAIRQGFYSYGVSSHAPLPFSTHWSMEMSNIDAYIRQIQGLKLKYASSIEIYLGLEIDYLTDDHYPGMPYFRELPLDYRIGSVHMLEDLSGQLADLDVAPEVFKQKIADRFDHDLRAVVVGYFDKLMRMVDRGGFDIVGHADKISMNASFCQPAVTTEPWYVQKVHEYFEQIARKGLMMEINTKAYLQKGYFFPNQEHFEFIRSLNIPVLVNSDAHFPGKINDGRDAALCALKNAGFQTVRELIKGEWQDVAIR